MDPVSVIGLLDSATGLLGKVYSMYSQLKEGKELCKRLHKRLENFNDELREINPKTLGRNRILQEFVSLIQKYENSVTSYAAEDNLIKRLWKAKKFLDQIKAYNIELDDVTKMITFHQAVTILEWRDQYNKDKAAMVNKFDCLLNDDDGVCDAFEQISQTRVEEMTLVWKRDISERSSLTSPLSQSSQSLDPVIQHIIQTAEDYLGKTLKNPPTWLIAADEVTTTGPAIDSKGVTNIFIGEWQGVQVAIKKFKFFAKKNPVFKKHFHVWHTLLHPHVTQLFGAGSDNGIPFFVYEYAGLESLDRCNDQLSHKDLRRVLYQAALGLTYLHKQRAVHGNLSCSRILVTEQGNAKIFGFGASYIRINSKSNSIKPTISKVFAAPECIGIGPNGVDSGSDHSPSFTSDVYSFGLTIIQAFTKRTLTDGAKTSEEIRELKRMEQLPRPDDLSNDVWHIVRQMCVCDPEKRASIEHVTEQLKHVWCAQ